LLQATIRLIEMSMKIVVYRPVTMTAVDCVVDRERTDQSLLSGGAALGRSRSGHTA
jgi:hypothetical protein